MNKIYAQFQLAPELLYQRSDLEKFGFSSTADLEPLDAIIGQQRALDAINFAVEMPHGSFNLYVMGSSGLGRHALIHEALSRRAQTKEKPGDWCYVANYQQPDAPHVLKLPAGTGYHLRSDLQQLVEDLLNAIPAAFQGDEYRRRHAEIHRQIKDREEAATAELDKLAAKLHLQLLRGSTGFILTPVKDDKPLSTEAFDALPDEQKQQFRDAMDRMKAEMKAAMGKLPEWQREFLSHLRKLDSETMTLSVNQFVKRLEEKYHQLPQVIQFLEGLKADIIDNGALFRRLDDNGEQTAIAGDAEFNRYLVNILVDNSSTHGAPIVYEDNPTYQNLIGRIEHVAYMGTLQTDFTLIKAGALHRANGGFLLLDAEKVLSNPFAWEGLKRVLRAGEIRIQSVERQLSLVNTISLEPQAVAIDLKVVLIGSRQLYYLLREYDPEFSLLFKVLADFSEELARGDENELLFARLIATLQHREGLREIARDGVARIIENSARRSWDSEKLSLHMGSLIDLLREADYQAGKHDSLVVGSQHVQAAINAQAHRADQLQERLREDVINGTLRIDTTGSQLAQVNGLSVLQLGDYMFGAPARISATARLGNGELIDIERESELGGQLHSKGVLILSSYIGERYAKHQPLSLSASLVFEQSYSIVEGDSASAAELCALLSSLANIPIRQSLAITGSINQHGQMQAIGGVCEKIEGFFDLCNQRGLSGEQGVIIPASNVRNLMLKQAVVQAAAAGKFHIYAVEHVEHAMELLTGLPAGQQDAEGVFSEGSFNYLIQLRLAEWMAIRQQFAGPPPRLD